GTAIVMARATRIRNITPIVQPPRPPPATIDRRGRRGPRAAMVASNTPEIGNATRLVAGDAAGAGDAAAAGVRRNSAPGRMRPARRNSARARSTATFVDPSPCAETARPTRAIHPPHL